MVRVVQVESAILDVATEWGTTSGHTLAKDHREFTSRVAKA